MSNFSINPSKINPEIQEMYNVSVKLKQCANDINSVRNALLFSPAVNASIGKNLKAISEDLVRESQSCNKMSVALSSSVRFYVNTEKSIVSGTPVAQATPAPGNSAAKKSENTLSKAVYKTIIGALGPAGHLIDAVNMGIQGKPGNVISDLVKLAGGFAKNFDGSSVNWAKWFGILEPSVGPVKYTLSKYTDFSSVGKGISSACQWAAAIITSGFSNFKEFGNFGKRFWEETAVESLIKVGETIAVGTAIGAVVAAAGISAPALAITAATAGAVVLVDMGLDAVVKWATHGSQTSWVEAASDFVCDTGEKVVGWAKNTAKDVGKTISNGFNSIKNAFVNRGGSKSKWGFLAI